MYKEKLLVLCSKKNFYSMDIPHMNCWVRLDLCSISALLLAIHFLAIVLKKIAVLWRITNVINHRCHFLVKAACILIPSCRLPFDVVSGSLHKRMGSHVFRMRESDLTHFSSTFSIYVFPKFWRKKKIMSGLAKSHNARVFIRGYSDSGSTGNAT